MTTQADKTLTMIREVCALGRVEFDRPHTPEGDPDAGRALVKGLRALDLDGEPSDISPSLDLPAPRAPYSDRLVLDAIESGTRQVVTLGSGYDDRTLRFRHSGIQFFELDLPDIIADKTHHLGTDTTHITLAPADFASDDVTDVLNRAGHDSQQPTLFIAEHLVLFLKPNDVARLIAGTSHRAAKGSTLALTTEAHPAGLESALVISAVDDMFAGAGPLHTIKSRDAWLALPDQHGWQVHDAAEVVAVNHFELPMTDQPAQIQTQFLSATTT
ncbi:class I SAM-dependent methyltransferase [Streptomyces sp. NPDC056937]|uniref:class I SAM-dependent methyltransferase n=1 Tax=Streptomyces sp. NPDC056937 TaxID=3345969 RepID=UPI003627D33E